MTGLARSAKARRLDLDAEEYEQVASMIDSGRMTIRGADPDQVKARVRDKAERIRAGQVVHRKKRSYGFGSAIRTDDDLFAEEEPVPPY